MKYIFQYFFICLFIMPSLSFADKRFMGIKVHSRISGSLRARVLKNAIRIQDGKKHFYINEKSLLKRISPGNEQVQHFLKEDRYLNREVGFLLAPRGTKKGTSVETLTQFIKYMDNHLKRYPLNKVSYTKLYTEDELKEIRNQIVELVSKLLDKEFPRMLNYDRFKIRRMLRPGDLFFKHKYDRHQGSILKYLQHFIYRYADGNPEFIYDITHTAIYVKNLKIVESSAHLREDGRAQDVGTLRVLDINDPLFFPKGYKLNLQYWIYRYNDQKLAKRTAQIAKLYASAPPDTLIKNYSLKRALISALGDPGFGPQSRKLFTEVGLLAIANTRAKDLHVIKTLKRRFFCSYFVAYALQAAESEAMLLDLEKKGKIKLPNFEKFKTVESLKIGLDRFNKRIQKPLRKYLKKNVKLRFDAKNTTPVNFRAFVLKNPELFTPVGRIISGKRAK